ncbi:MAG: hypothetical protein WBV55_10830 [Candidatus Sulfotelmatobacter sp.]
MVVLVVLVVCFVLWYTAASDYGDGVASGTYHFAENGEESVLVLKPDHSFRQELSGHGEVKRASGTWRRVGEGGIAFSKDFLLVSGQEPDEDGTAYADIHKDFGLFVSLILRQYHVLWYGRVDASPGNAVSGTYAGDEPEVSATLMLKPDHTFEQVIHTVSITKQTKGRWSVGQNGDIIFSKDFLKASGEVLRSDETASAWNPRGSNLQIQITTSSGSGAPTFRKKELF